MKDAKGIAVAGVSVRITVDGQYPGISTTDATGFYSYSGASPTSAGLHMIKVIFDGNTKYASSQTSQGYYL